MTEASAKICGPENRDGFIRATLHSRSVMPHFDHKSNYKL